MSWKNPLFRSSTSFSARRRFVSKRMFSASVRIGSVVCVSVIEKRLWNFGLLDFSDDFCRSHFAESWCISIIEDQFITVLNVFDCDETNAQSLFFEHRRHVRFARMIEETSISKKKLCVSLISIQSEPVIIDDGVLQHFDLCLRNGDIFADFDCLAFFVVLISEDTPSFFRYWNDYHIFRGQERQHLLETCSVWLRESLQASIACPNQLQHKNHSKILQHRKQHMDSEGIEQRLSLHQ